MPLYEYECEACGSRFEVIRKFSDPPLETCTRCGNGPVQRLPSTPAIQFKGSGWYITDYSEKGKAPSEGSTKSETKKTESGTTDGASTKTDSSGTTAAPKPSSET
jgi:putative FmdB family regulatory protein